MRGPGLPVRSGDDQYVAVIALVAVRRPWRHKLARPRTSEQVDARAVEAVDHIDRDPDVGDDDVAGTHFRRHEHEGKLGRRQRDGGSGINGLPDRIGGVGGQARGQVDRDDGDAGRVDVGDDALDEAADGRVQARAEDRIDDERGVADFRDVQLPRLAVGHLDDGQPETPEDVEVHPRVAADVRHLADEKYGDADAALRQGARDNEAVATIVTPATQDGDVAVGQIAVD